MEPTWEHGYYWSGCLRLGWVNGAPSKDGWGWAFSPPGLNPVEGSARTREEAKGAVEAAWRRWELPDGARHARKEDDRYDIQGYEVMNALTNVTPAVPVEVTDQGGALTVPPETLSRGESKPDPLMLIQAALDKNVDPDRLGKLLDLQERWERSRAVEAYNRAMKACQAEMPVISRRADNPQTKSKYARFEDIQEVAKPIYTRHGFSLSFGEAPPGREGWKRIIVEVSHEAGETRTFYTELPIDGVGAKGNPIGSMNQVQAARSTNSYGKRGLICDVFNITVANEDRDGRGSNRVSADRAAAPRETFLAKRQVAELRDLLRQTGRDEAHLCTWAGVARIELIPLAKYQEAVRTMRAHLQPQPATPVPAKAPDSTQQNRGPTSAPGRAGATAPAKQQSTVIQPRRSNGAAPARR